MPELNTPLRPRPKFRPFRMYSEEELRAARRKRQAATVFIATIIILTVVGYAYVQYNSYFEKSTDARVATHALTLSSKVNGKVQKVLVTETQLVKAGDLLVQIDPREFQAVLDERQRELARSDDHIAGAKVSMAKLQEKLATGGDAARQKYEGGRAWYVRLQSKNQELRAAVAEASENLKATEIRAPGDGHIAQKSIDAGKSVTVGQPLINFVETGRPWLNANFRETQLSKMKVGQKAEISVVNVGKTFTGQVETIARNKPYAELPNNPVQNIIGRFIETPGGERVAVRVLFNPDSVKGYENRLIGGAAAEVKVYIK